MDAKDKATELVDKFYNEIDCASLTDEISEDKAKQCALICVDEMLKEIKPSLVYHKRDVEYWQEVKEEIEKL